MSRIGAVLRQRELLRSSAADGMFDQKPDLVIAGFAGNESMAFENASRVGVNHEHWMTAGVQRDGVGRFWSHAVERQQLWSKSLRGRGKHAVQRAAVVGVQKGDKCLQTVGLLPEIA